MAGSPTFERQFKAAEILLPKDVESARLKYEQSKSGYEKAGNPPITIELQRRNDQFLRELATPWLDELDASLTANGPELSKEKIDEFVRKYRQDFIRVFKSDPASFKDVEKRITDIRNKIELSLKPPEATDPTALDRKRWVESIENFLIQRKIELRSSRPEFKDTLTYLDYLYQEILRHSTITMLNNQFDKVDTNQVRTAHSLTNPMVGPIAEFSLIGATLLYDNDTTQRVKSLESLLDYIDYYFDPADKDVVKAFGERVKHQLSEISTWHNRGALRREAKHQSAAGPEGAFSALSELFNNKKYNPEIYPLFGITEKNGYKYEDGELLASEKQFIEALECSMAIWSIMALSKQERKAYWDKLNPTARDLLIADQTTCEIKDEFNVLPIYTSDENVRREAVLAIHTAIVGKSKLDPMLGWLAYHVGESYRVGSGLDAFFDVRYKPGKVIVQAQEGEPKSANIGLYVDNATSNPVRPDFVVPYKDYLVHGYPPYGRAAQYSHTLDPSIGHFGDSRASLIELLACDGGFKHIDWNSRSTDPDKIVFQAANQATNFLWKSASIKGAKSGDYTLSIDPSSVPLKRTFLQDLEGERLRVATEFGWMGKSPNWYSRARSRLFQKPSLGEIEQDGFFAESTTLSGQKLQKLKTLYKDYRDYWLAAFTPDVDRHPYDAMRLIKYMFSRDDGPGGYVNQKIGKRIEEKKGNDPKNGSWFEAFKNWMRGYINYDLLLRSNFYLFSPYVRNLGIKTRDDVQLTETYNELSATNYENFALRTIADTPVLNVARLAYLINQSMEILNAVPEEKDYVTTSGYQLYEDRTIPKKIIFEHEDLLELAREFHMGQGYSYVIEDEPGGKGKFWKLQRDEGPPTVQWICDRLVLLQSVFDPKSLGL